MNKRFTDFTKIIRGKKVAVIGIAISNTPLIEFLSAHGARVTAFDRLGAGELADRINRLRHCNVEYRLGPDYLSGLNGFEWIFKTPVIRPDIPELIAERGRGAVVTSEMELFLELCPSTVFGVTGSDGKTTTTTLIYEMLKAHGYKCYLGGNIGRPLLSEAESMTPADMAVVELSSFQLLAMKNSVNVAVITNLSPNHLDVHKSYGEYIDAKKNIFRYQSSDDLCVLNYDNAQTRALYPEVPGRLGFFSRLEPGAFDWPQHKIMHEHTGSGCPASGAMVSGATPSAATFPGVPGPLFYPVIDKSVFAAAYVKDDNFLYRDAASADYAHFIMRQDDIRIPGRHNVENYLAAICAAYRYVGNGDIVATARGFNGVEHRIEYFRTVNGADYYNDSIASSPTRTIACLNTFGQKIILIAGGKDKAIDYTPLGQYLAKKVKLLILCGETSGKIKKSLLNFCDAHEMPCTVPIIECESYEDAVSSAYENAKQKDIVVLSPASTSFDRFRNFEERGRVFKKLVNELPNGS